MSESKLKIKKVRLVFDEWKCIRKKRYGQMKVDSDDFRGYLALIHIDQVAVPQIQKWKQKEVTVCDKDRKWLIIVPDDGTFSITVMMDFENKVLIWYIDINDGVDEDGTFYVYDLFLDLLVHPNGEFKEEDREELEIALEQGIISKEQFSKANKTAEKLTKG